MATVTVHNWSEFIAAVAVAGDDVEFPHDSTHLVKTQDTAVNPNKLYLDSNGVVQTNVQPADLPDLYENTFVLDANDDNDLRLGFTTPITIACNSINGFGGYIKNPTSSSVNIFEFSDVCSVTAIGFLNVNGNNVYPFYTAGKLISFNYCIFSGEITNVSGAQKNFFHGVISGSQFNFTSCSFNIKLTGAACSPFPMAGSDLRAVLLYCRLELNTDDMTGSSQISFCPINCYITGNWTPFNTITITGKSQAVPYASIFEIISAATINQAYYYPATNTLINNELYTGTIPSNISGVSSTDLTNAQTLRDTYRFPIQT